MDLSGKTLEEVLNIYNANLVWEGNITVAKTYLSCIRWLLANRPTSHQAGQVKVDYDVLQNQEKTVSEYVYKLSINKSKTRVAKVKYF